MKLLRSSAAVLLASLSLARASAAQDPAAALPAAREVIDRYVEVARMKPVLEKTKSMHITGTVAVKGMEISGPAEVWSARPALRRVSIEMGAFGTMVTGYDGKVAWMTHPMMGARVLAGMELLQAKLESDYDAALKTGDGYVSLRTVARETFEGKECYKVELVAKPLDGMDAAKTLATRTSYEFYEVESGLLAGSQGRQESEMGGGPYTTVTSDYKDFGGQLVATKNLVRQSGQEIVMTFDKVEYDTATSETFALPKDVQAKLAPPPKAEPKPQ